jgi:hypothetical protein
MNVLETSAQPNVGGCCKHCSLSNNISTLFIGKRVALKIIYSLQQRNICRGEFGMFITEREAFRLYKDHPLLDLTTREHEMNNYVFYTAG